MHCTYRDHVGMRTDLHQAGERTLGIRLGDFQRGLEFAHAIVLLREIRQRRVEAVMQEQPLCESVNG
jgi:hypothetical protein